MAELILIATADWEQATPEMIQRALDAYGGSMEQLRVYVNTNLSEISIIMDENRFPSPETMAEGMFIQDSFWFRVIPTPVE